MYRGDLDEKPCCLILECSRGEGPASDPALPRLKCSRRMDCCLFVHTLVLTDVATGWTECAPLLLREQVLLKSVLGELRNVMPFDLLGFDTDNDTVFMNETVRDYCQAEGHHLHALSAISQERSGFCRAEERRRGPPHRGLSSPRRHGGCGVPGPALRDGTAVRERLPALLQADREGAGRCAGSEVLPSSGDAVRAAVGGPADLAGGARSH